MKNIYLIFFILLSYISYSQAWHEKSQVFQVGIGESYTFNKHVEEHKSLYTSKNTRNYGKIVVRSSPTIFLKYEHALNKYIGIGMVIGYRKTDITQIIPHSYYDSTITYTTPFGVNYYLQKPANDIFTFELRDLNIGARLNCHFISDKKIDPYIGLAMGYRLFNRDYQYSSDNPHGLYYVVEYNYVLPIYTGATVGIKYIFTKEIGIYAELGFDKRSVIQAGIIFNVR